MFYSCIKPLLFALPPELAHRAALGVLRYVPRCGVHEAAPMLHVRAFGLEFAHPLGLAAGFDKNAECVDALLRLGFSFVEAGTCTPRPQSGNPKPRVFRLAEDEAIINRLGFNNAGAEAFAARLAQRAKTGIVGANIGKNRDSADAVADYVTMLRYVAPYASYVTVNISSPNTQGLRDLQERTLLSALLSALQAERAVLAQHGECAPPLLLKVAPDLSEEACVAIAEVALEHGIDGMIVSNTTVARPPLRSVRAMETGGLSGRPLMASSTAVLRTFYRLTQGTLPLIGVGGVFSAEDAYSKITAGASLVQMYTGLIYQGPALVRRIVHELPALLRRDGFTHIAQAVGTRAYDNGV